MATLGVIVWIIVVLLFFKEFYDILENDPLSGIFFSVILMVLLVGHVIIISLITEGIFFDLYGKYPRGELTTIENVRLVLISGFVALGTVSISSFLIDRNNRKDAQKRTADVRYSQLSPNRYSISSGKTIMLGVEIISLISSVLGIISFYLDYLK